MTKNRIIAVVILYAALQCSSLHPALLAGSPSPVSDIATYLPHTGELEDWEPSGDPQLAEGEDLFLLINGGAEVFHEYGFKQAIIGEYQNKSSESARFNIEIYRMQNSQAAYGVYTFKTGDSGKKLDIGSGAEALLEDYYLNFWKGDFYVTVIGFDSSESTLTAITAAAKLVASKIKKTSQKPRLIELLPKRDSSKMPAPPQKVKYIMGNLGLFNNYQFDSRDIFGVKEGVIGYYKDVTVFIFHYPDETESRQWFARAVKHLKQGKRYSTDPRDIAGSTFIMRDKKGKLFHIEHYKDYIIILISSDKSNKQRLELFKSIRNKI